MADHSEFDSATGKTTTGHQWDGIKELNTPRSEERRVGKEC